MIFTFVMHHPYTHSVLYLLLIIKYKATVLIVLHTEVDPKSWMYGVGFNYIPLFSFENDILLIISQFLLQAIIMTGKLKKYIYSLCQNSIL